MIDVSSVLTPEWVPWAVFGTVVGLTTFVFLIAIIHHFVVYLPSAAAVVHALVITLVAFLVFMVLAGITVTVMNSREDDRVYGQLENSYGISQLECTEDACTWVDANNRPAAGTLVDRDMKAGLLDSDQKPLPVINE